MFSSSVAGCSICLSLSVPLVSSVQQDTGIVVSVLLLSEVRNLKFEVFVLHLCVTFSVTFRDKEVHSRLITVQGIPHFAFFLHRACCQRVTVHSLQASVCSTSFENSSSFKHLNEVFVDYLHSVPYPAPPHPTPPHLTPPHSAR